ncbi:hypothetical protein ABRT01_15270 [Lentibacillus sp. L22]|uniref:hypothetical protein n=1 Tax=Lentibacillus TaxID=175304 RepID=UPI0022B0D579|nr:hypothetical protein [Lentibacillus daqui]
MKNRSCFTNNQRGFIFPYVLFITAIILLVVTAKVSAYQNDIRISHNHENQLTIETLVQMGHEQFKQEMNKHPGKKGHVSYHYPPGNVTITYTQKSPKKYDLLFQVPANDKTYSTTMILELDEVVQTANKE